MGFVLATARKDLLRLRRDWPSLLLWIGIPLLVGGILVLMFGGDASPRARLLVADEDESIVGRLVTGGFSQGPLAEIVDVEAVESDEGRRRIEKGDGSAFLVIPEGFGDALLDGRAASLELVTNPSQSILPEILVSSLDVELEAAEVLRRLYNRVGDRLVLISVGGIETADDAWDRIVSGASLLQGYTGFIYGGGLWAKHIHDGIARRLHEGGFSSLSEAVGSAAR